MFTVNYQYRVYPSLEQEIRMVSWLEICRGVYNYALGERKDWITYIASRSLLGSPRCIPSISVERKSQIATT